VVAAVSRLALARLQQGARGQAHKLDAAQPGEWPALERAGADINGPFQKTMKISSNAEQIARRVATWSEQVTPELARATLSCATLLTAAGKRESPVKTGRMRRSISYVAGGPARYVVSPNVPYAAAVHSGTKPHVIVPTRKKALFWQGARHPVRRVNHPGTKGDPFMTRALDKSTPQIRRIAADAGANIVTSRA
jgi:hypothetical protein